MLYSDGNGFPLTVKPSHLYGSTERMDAAEILSAIVDEACRYVPEMTPTNVEKPKRLTKELRYPKEALFEDDKGSPSEELSEVLKVPAVSGVSNLVRIK